MITRAVLRLQPQTAAPCTALCAVDGFDAAVKLCALRNVAWSDGRCV